MHYTVLELVFTSLFTMSTKFGKNWTLCKAINCIMKNHYLAIGKVRCITVSNMYIETTVMVIEFVKLSYFITHSSCMF